MDEAQKLVDEVSQEKKVEPKVVEPKKEKIKTKPVKQKRPPKIKIKSNLFKAKIKGYFKGKESVGFVKDFVFYIIAYGIPITYMVWALVVCSSYWLKIPAFGIAFYLIKEELPYIWGKLVNSRTRR